MWLGGFIWHRERHVYLFIHTLLLLLFSQFLYWGHITYIWYILIYIQLISNAGMIENTGFFSQNNVMNILLEFNILCIIRPKCSLLSCFLTEKKSISWPDAFTAHCSHSLDSPDPQWVHHAAASSDTHWFQMQVPHQACSRLPSVAAREIQNWFKDSF